MGNPTDWVIYTMRRDGVTIRVPIYEVKDREDDGWRRIPVSLPLG